LTDTTNISSNAALTTLDGIQSSYFIGIGGIGMSALARYFLLRGIKVSGYDRARTELTEALENEGIAIYYEENLDRIPRDADLVVYTPAVPQQHQELNYYRDHGFNVVKRSDVLQAISAQSFNICVAGTHGKTTTSTLIAHILRQSGYGCNAFLGGISVNYHTNFWSSERNVCVIEADEYDRSFLKLTPDVAVITAMDPDHLDIYGTEQAMQDAFVGFGNKIRKQGLLLSKLGLNRIREVALNQKRTYSLQNNAADVFATNIRLDNGGYHFDAQVNGEQIGGFRLNIGGMHNVENAIAAIGVARHLNIPEEKVREAVAAFKGVRRRFEYIIPPKVYNEGAYTEPVLVDDYAHHPEELRALLTSVRSLFPQRLVTAVFQPHLFSRTKDLADGFAKALAIADRVILLPIYPARETPVEGVNSEMIISRMEDMDKQVLGKDDFLAWMEDHAKHLNKEFGEVIVMAGAGDIDQLVIPVKEILEKNS
jgi:UDP-N-acetylmuramate--alanine ligase